MRAKRIFPVVLAFIGVFAAGVASADMGPLAKYIEPRSGEPWDVAWDGDRAVLTNRSTESRITYFYVKTPPELNGHRTVSVDVSLRDPSDKSLGGVLYGYEADPETYFLFAVGSDKTVRLYRCEGGSFHERLRLDMPELDLANTRLGVHETAGRIELLVNGQPKSTFADANLGHGAVGIVAAHIGQYVFDDFRIAVDH